MFRNSLFVRIYFTVIASLVLAALVIAVVTSFGQRDPRDSLKKRSARFMETFLPADQTPEQLQTSVAQLAKAFQAGVAVYGENGRLQAIAIDPQSRPLPAMPEVSDLLKKRQIRDRDLFKVILADGRQVVTNIDLPGPPEGWRSPIVIIMLIVGAIGLGAYPVVRQLTRRLEALRHGVENWGRGNLAHRVAEDGSDEIASVGRSFNLAARQVEQLIAGHRTLLANASHELRSPLARLRMAIELYENVQHESMKAEIIRNMGELDSLVEEILLASKLDSVDGLEWREIVDFLAVVAEEASMDSIDIDGVPVSVNGDSRLLRRMVRNLMQNALKHGAPPVTVRVEKSGPETLRLIIGDKGAGLPVAERERVFEPFYRPVGRSERSGGWGLGLALVKQIAEHHGGSVRYEAPASGGASFVVELPILG